MDIVLTIADKELARILQAYARTSQDPVTLEPVVIPATVDDVAAVLFNHLRGHVTEFEVGQAAHFKRDEVGAEIWDTKTEVKPTAGSLLPSTRR